MPYFAKYKTSAGIACCRFNGERPEVLIVRKRCTYAYVTFLHGKYKSTDNGRIMYLFNKMTSDEKFDILSLNFDQMWYRAWQHSPRKSLYYTAKAKFEATFLRDGGVGLRGTIMRARSAQPHWEIPKGVKNNDDESDIVCAVREFEEETGIPKNQYRIINGARSFHVYTDDDTHYTQIYYICANVCCKPRVVLDYHNSEIAEIKWADICEIRRLDPQLVDVVKPIFNYCKANRDQFDIEYQNE